MGPPLLFVWLRVISWIMFEAQERTIHEATRNNTKVEKRPKLYECDTCARADFPVSAHRARMVRLSLPQASF